MSLERHFDYENGLNYVLHQDPRAAEKMYCTEFTVVGRGHFPYDMLRYDMCHPVDSTSAGNMHFDYAQMSRSEREAPREVKLRCWSRHKFWRPTYARWQSFGWVVTTDTYESQKS